MIEIESERFWRWLSEADIGHTPRYCDPEFLLPEGARPCARFWTFPATAEALDTFFRCVLNAIAAEQAAYLWPRCAVWEYLLENVADLASDSPFRPFLASSGSFAISVPPGEPDRLIEFFQFVSEFGWKVCHDLYVIPEDRAVVAYISHHAVFHVSAKQEATLERIIGEMEKNGFSLPKELPDATFKRPDWM